LAFDDRRRRKNLHSNSLGFKSQPNTNKPLHDYMKCFKSRSAQKICVVGFLLKISVPIVDLEGKDPSSDNGSKEISKHIRKKVYVRFSIRHKTLIRRCLEVVTTLKR